MAKAEATMAHCVGLLNCSCYWMQMWQGQVSFPCPTIVLTTDRYIQRI